jgi:hypothetical protein
MGFAVTAADGAAAARRDAGGGLVRQRANRVPMQDLTAKRTLVKSQPELWEELSEVERLAKHLGEFGEIKITRLEPEHTVAWEGKHASGTVSIEPSGWGTKVTLTAELAENGDPPDRAAEAAGEAIEPAEPPDEPETEVEEGPTAEVEAAFAGPGPAPEPAYDPLAATITLPQPRRRGFWSRLFAGWLVPEERLNRATFKLLDGQVSGQAAGAPEAPAKDGVEDEPPANVEAVATAAADDAAPTEDPPPTVNAAAAVPAQETPSLAVATDGQKLADHTTDTDGLEGIGSERARSVLEETLDALGSAHHRPYSRG